MAKLQEKTNKKIGGDSGKSSSKVAIDYSIIEDGNKVANEIMFGKSLVEEIQEGLTNKGIALHIPVKIGANPEEAEELEEVSYSTAKIEGLEKEL